MRQRAQAESLAAQAMAESEKDPRKALEIAGAIEIPALKAWALGAIAGSCSLPPGNWLPWFTACCGGASGTSVKGQRLGSSDTGSHSSEDCIYARDNVARR